MKVKIDTDTCTGCTLCTNSCPDIFKMEGDTAVVAVSAIPDDSQEVCKQAVEECPVAAIAVE